MSTGSSHPRWKVGDGTISPRSLGEWTGICCAAQPIPLTPTRALWPKMFPSPFLILDSIPPTLPPPSGNVAAINSLNASADAGAGCAKTPFLGPGLSWVSSVLGCAGASGSGSSLWHGGKCWECSETPEHVKISGFCLQPGGFHQLSTFRAASPNHSTSLGWLVPHLASPASASLPHSFYHLPPSSL